jgi:alpha-glucosidase
LKWKYGIFKTEWDELDAEIIKDGSLTKMIVGPYSIKIDNQGSMLFETPGQTLKVALYGRRGKEYDNEGFRIDIPLNDEERLYGLGDETRKMIMKRGHKAEMWIKNVVAYGPVPFVMSNKGWAILTNCTYNHTFDLGATQHDLLRIDAEKGVMDFYVFFADSMPGLLNAYTNVSGKPLILPKSGYGFTFVCNEEETARDLVEDCCRFRKLEIPCDYMGLEPGWMQKHYDYSINKKWDPVRFYIPHWEAENYNGTWSFFFNLRKMGFLLSLWLCCDYDLFWEEEKIQMQSSSADFEGAQIVDEHFSKGIIMDKITKHGEPWFEHLKKFVDQGAAAFKLDGSNHIIEHPDRLWAGKYLDDEAHNIYPVIYVKQMKEEYEKYTGKRALMNTPGIYAGTQQYAASWAGDTGGKLPTLVSILNLSLSGHANHSCDLDVSTLESMHYGFLMPWVQQNGWRNWLYPWMIGEELGEAYKYYSQMRSSLFPYIYSMAHIAAQTGMPIARPLCLSYPDNPSYDNIMHEYMFGDYLLVGAFDMHLILPPGKWVDFWTSEVYEGNKEIDYVPPKGRGGALLVREGSIFVTQDWMPYLMHHIPELLYIQVYPGADAEFVLYEDDGITYAYKNGEVAKTVMRISGTNVEAGEFNVEIDKRTGSFEGMAPVSSFDVIIHTAKRPRSITHNNDKVEFTYDVKTSTAKFRIDAKEHERNNLVYHVCI